MAAVKEVWIISDGGKALAELCACAREVGENVTALVIASKGEAERALRLGADAVWWLGEAGDSLNESRMVEDYVETAASLIKDGKPGLVLLRADKRGRLFAGRLGALLGTAALADVKTFGTKDGALIASHMLFGGGAVRVEKPCVETALALVPGGAFQAAAEDAARSGAVVELPFIAPKATVKVLERRKRGGSAVDLSGAKRVVGVGRGVGKQEDLALVENLAKAMEAEVACSRPIAEGVNWLPRERYLGVSGQVIKPELYLALGISGQVQHMVGVLDTKVIVAVNKDKNAPIFQQADYGIVGDLYKVIPLLLAALK
jgi:electron transfer flavoprotein alpha subunit